MKKIVLRDGSELIIRRAETNDAGDLIDYKNQVGGESNFLSYGKNGCRNTVEQEKEFLENMLILPNSIYLVGWIGEDLACSANLMAEQKERIAHNCELGISVRKKYWGLGAASALLTELIHFAKDNGTLKTIHLDVYENNDNAIRLYEKYGFQTAGRLKRYFRVGDNYFDDIVMDLYL